VGTGFPHQAMRQQKQHRAEKWAPVFRTKRCGNKNLEQALLL